LLEQHFFSEIFLILFFSMDDEVVLSNVLPFLTPKQSYLLFSRLSSTSHSILVRNSDSWNTAYPVCNFPEFIKELWRLGDLENLLNNLFVALRKDREAAINQSLVNGDCLVHFLCRKAYCPAVHLVVQSGIDVNLKGSGDMTPLHCAAFGKSDAIVDLLLRAGADPNIPDAIGRLPEDWATVQQNYVMARKLRKTREGETSISASCFPFFQMS
jgi:hypothetical protein